MNSGNPLMGKENRKETLAALKRAVRAYWEHEKSRPVPDHLVKLAAADEAFAKQTSPSLAPKNAVG